MRSCARAVALLVFAACLGPGQISTARTPHPDKKAPDIAPDPAAAASAREPMPPGAERLTYGVEWKLTRAGTVVVQTQNSKAEMNIESSGLVSALFKIHDTYTVHYEEPLCATSSLMDSEEGKRRHETKVTYDRSQGRATYLERDVLKGVVLHSDEVAIPNCVHEVIGAFLALRSKDLGPGQTAQIAMSDGRRAAPVKVEAQEREEIKTPAGTYPALRCEAYMLNGVIYPRKGRAFVWLSDDARRLPVQIRLRLQFPIGTVTLQLEKEEHS